MTGRWGPESWKVRIRPTLMGASWLLLCVACLLLAFHFNSNMALAFVFMLLALWIVSPLFGYVNMLGVSAKFTGAPAVFCSEKFRLKCHLSRNVQSLCMAIPTLNKEIQKSHIDVENSECMELEIIPEKRGILHMEKFDLSSGYPFGFFKFSRLIVSSDPMQVLVYPEIAGTRKLPEFQNPKGSKNVSDLQDSSDIREYIGGDPVSRIHWRQSARGLGLMTKQFDEGQQSEDLLLQLPAHKNFEEALSQLTKWVVEADRQNLPFRLELVGKTGLQGQGKRHVAKCLEILASMPQDQKDEHA